MASQQTVLDYIGKALWDPKPTRSDRQARQLAEALGYPDGWRVVRTLEEVTAPAISLTCKATTTTAGNNDDADKAAPETVVTSMAHAAAATNSDKVEAVAAQPEQESVSDDVKAEQQSFESVRDDAIHRVLAPRALESTTAVQPGEPKVKTDEASVTNEAASNTTEAAESVAAKEAEQREEESKESLDAEMKDVEPAEESKEPLDAEMKDVEPAEESKEPLDAEMKDVEPALQPVDTTLDDSKPSAVESSTPTQPDAPTTKTYICIVDRIYAGDPKLDCDMFVHHEAAMEAAKAWDPETSTPFDFAGGHLLPRQPLYQKGDKVQVLYTGEWWEATILRRTSHPEHGFKYQVHYSDRTKQSGVDERLIRSRPTDKDPRLTAAGLGLGDGWTAVATGNNKWKIVSPDGDAYSSKKKALEVYQATTLQSSSGDPPWRTTDHEYLDRKVFWTTTHKVSARRAVTVEQVGTVVGWISETDVDRAGDPGFVSERTGKPARLFHVVFPEDPHHQYASLLIQTQDLEEYELVECMIAEDQIPGPLGEPAKKKARGR